MISIINKIKLIVFMFVCPWSGQEFAILEIHLICR